MGTKKGFKRIGISRLYAVVSISLVLFLVGISFLIFIHGNKLVNQVKESFEFMVTLKDTATETSYLSLADKIRPQKYVHSIEYVSKEEAMNRYIAQTKDDFRDIINHNPLPSTINIKLNAPYVNKDSIAVIEASLLKENLVVGFEYDKPNVEEVNSKTRKIAFIVGGISIILLLITIIIIDSTIRLSMYSNRFTIRSMQLVGATRWFILRPFLSQGVIDGILSSLIAVAGLGTMLNFLLKIIPELTVLQEVNLTLTLFGLVFLVGILFSVLSTYFAVLRYLKMKLDDLY